MLKDIIYYILDKISDSTQLNSNARVTKLVYLSDWKSCLENGTQLSNINWYFDNYGPFVREIENEIEKNNDIFKSTESYFFNGSKRKTFSIKSDYEPQLNEQERKVIDFIIEKTNDLSFPDFIDYVYSTYPIYKSDRYTNLDLVKLANEYKSIS